MTIATVKIISERFLRSPKPEVLAIKGAWGVGKTYTWKKIFEENRESCALKYYCYTSLFGISSVQELALSIFSKTQNIENTCNKRNIKILLNEAFTLANKIGIPYVKNLSIGLQQLASYLIKNTIICLDDFERTSLAPEAVLGFISSLKEESDCKIILIFNEQNLGNSKDTYKRYREKVIDIELLFSPSLSEAIEWGFPQNMPNRDIAIKYSNNLGISNVRILQKISETINLLNEQLKDLHAGVMQKALPMLILLTWSYYDTNENTPNFRFIIEWDPLKHVLMNKAETENPNIKKWVAIIRSYGLTEIDEFDLAISKVIEYGHIEETGLLTESSKLDAKLKANDLNGSFSQAWDFFHNSFEDDEEKVITAIKDGFNNAYQQISPVDLNSAVRLLRNLGRDADANKMIDHYIKKRTEEHSLFDLDKHPFSGRIDDQLLRDRFKEVVKANLPKLTLLDTIRAVAMNRSCSPEQLQVIEQATEENYYDLFMNNQGENLVLIIQSCLWFETASGKEYLAEKPRAALERIGRLSRLNALRVQNNFGVTVKPAPSIDSSNHDT